MIRSHPEFEAHFTNSSTDRGPATRGHLEPTMAPTCWQSGRRKIAETYQEPRLQDVLGADPKDVWRTAIDDDDTADWLISAAFVILRLTGTLLTRDLELTLRMLQRQAKRNPTFDDYQVILHDLEAWYHKVGGRTASSRNAQPAPWLILEAISDHPSYKRWLRTQATAIMTDPAWIAWKRHLPVEPIVLVPTPGGPSDGWMQFNRIGNAVTVVGSSGELIVNLANSDQDTERAGLHNTTPEAAQLIRETIREMLRTVSQQLGGEAPPLYR